MRFLEGSVFDKDFMQSKVKSTRITGKERFWGHIMGPGFTYVFLCVVSGLRELYYMDVLSINSVFGSAYTYLIMTTVTSVLGVATGFFINYMTEKTVCRAGRFRPYVLVGTWIMVVAGFFMFWFPFENGSTAALVWLYVFNFLYNCVGLPLFSLKNNVVSVATRNILERNNITTIRQTVSNMIAGVIVSLVIIGTLYPMILQKDLSGKSWMVTIFVCGIVAVIFSIIEYYWTRERITEDSQHMMANQFGDATITIPLTKQLRILLTNKYYLLSILACIGVAIYSSMQGGNARVNMITYILGGNDENGLQILYLIASMQPMAIGAFVVPMLSKRFSARRIMQVSAVITLLGIGIAMINPYNFVVAVAGGFVFAAGIFAVTNMFNIFGQQAADVIEYEHGYRCEGTLAAGVISTIYTTLCSPLNALYETGLSLNGYEAGSMTQCTAVNNWVLLAYYGSYAFIAVVVFIVCIFFDAEKKMPDMHRELENRARKAAEARGEVYHTPAEIEQMEIESAAKELEENRIAELKKKCLTKGLDFETENAKYLEMKAAKGAKGKRNR